MVWNLSEIHCMLWLILLAERKFGRITEFIGILAVMGMKKKQDVCRGWMSDECEQTREPAGKG